DQFDEQIPDWLIHPTAGGTGIYAAWKGFNELLSLHLIDRAPKLVIAQSAAAAPIVEAFEKDLAEIVPVIARATIAESIQVGNPASLGWRALAAVRDSRGSAVAVSDRETLQAQYLIGSQAGIFAEPAAATSVAAAIKLRESGVIAKDDVVVCNLTGHGLKQPESIRITESQLQPIAPTMDALREKLQKGEIDI
ncbi:MAG TPA: pyridoxal-phosphate dependent enzyme, partial [Candidatus Polarisedimenticolaceae bacterium]|nr:pyridoxal-phosphate dependent enzyme [Candidatus Polarisedimenticolaceae bacterium]